MGHPAEVVMTPTMVKYLFEGARRADAKVKETPKSAEDLLAGFFAKLAMSGPKLPSVPTPRLMSEGAARKVMEFKPPPGMPGTMATSRMGAPKAPGLKTVKAPDAVVNTRVRPQDAIRKNTAAVKSPGLGGPGPMNVGS